jgi:hypothetical protein
LKAASTPSTLSASIVLTAGNLLKVRGFEENLKIVKVEILNITALIVENS